MPTPNPPRRPAPGYGSSRSSYEKLRIYLVGVAIGLMILGFVQWQKMHATPAPTPAPGAAAGAPATAPEPEPEPASRATPDAGSEPAPPDPDAGG